MSRFAGRTTSEPGAATPSCGPSSPRWTSRTSAAPGRSWLVVERLKRNANAGIAARCHSWRTCERQEIDVLEERADGLFAFELKGGGRKGRIPRLWLETHPESEAAVVADDDVDEFLEAPGA